MSMQSWGYHEILLDMTKAKEVAGSQYKKMNDLIEEEEPDLFAIEGMEVSNKLQKRIEKFIDKINNKLKVEIYPRYISSEAEGADGDEGSIIWCIAPEYKKHIVNAMSEHKTWSEFG